MITKRKNDVDPAEAGVCHPPLAYTNVFGDNWGPTKEGSVDERGTTDANNLRPVSYAELPNYHSTSTTNTQLWLQGDEPWPDWLKEGAKWPGYYMGKKGHEKEFWLYYLTCYCLILSDLNEGRNKKAAPRTDDSTARTHKWLNYGNPPLPPFGHHLDELVSSAANLTHTTFKLQYWFSKYLNNSPVTQLLFGISERCGLKSLIASRNPSLLRFDSFMGNWTTDTKPTQVEERLHDNFYLMKPDADSTGVDSAGVPSYNVDVLVDLDNPIPSEYKYRLHPPSSAVAAKILAFMEARPESEKKFRNLWHIRGGVVRAKAALSVERGQPIPSLALYKEGPNSEKAKNILSELQVSDYAPFYKWGGVTTAYSEYERAMDSVAQFGDIEELNTGDKKEIGNTRLDALRYARIQAVYDFPRIVFIAGARLNDGNSANQYRPELQLQGNYKVITPEDGPGALTTNYTPEQFFEYFKGVYLVMIDLYKPVPMRYSSLDTDVNFNSNVCAELNRQQKLYWKAMHKNPRFVYRQPLRTYVFDPMMTARLASEDCLRYDYAQKKLTEHAQLDMDDVIRSDFLDEADTDGNMTEEEVDNVVANNMKVRTRLHKDWIKHETKSKKGIYKTRTKNTYEKIQIYETRLRLEAADWIANQNVLNKKPRFYNDYDEYVGFNIFQVGEWYREAEYYWTKYATQNDVSENMPIVTSFNEQGWNHSRCTTNAIAWKEAQESLLVYNNKELRDDLLEARYDLMTPEDSKNPRRPYSVEAGEVLDRAYGLYKHCPNEDYLYESLGRGRYLNNDGSNPNADEEMHDESGSESDGEPDSRADPEDDGSFDDGKLYSKEAWRIEYEEAEEKRKKYEQVKEKLQEKLRKQERETKEKEEKLREQEGEKKQQASRSKKRGREDRENPPGKNPILAKFKNQRARTGCSAISDILKRIKL